MLSIVIPTLDASESLGRLLMVDLGEDESKANKVAKQAKMDPDHRLLLRSTKPLLQSRNASVVMATAQLYHHLAPKAEVQVR